MGEYFGSGGTIQGTTQYGIYDRDEQDPHRSENKMCPLCYELITNKAKYCHTCAKELADTKARNRAEFKRRAAGLSREDIEALAAQQMEIVRQRLRKANEARA